MSFIKDIVIYEKNAKVYINQCYNKGKKTKFFTVRRDDATGLGHILGSIHWHGSWRQYCFFPEKDTIWSAGCMNGIIDFIQKTNMEHSAMIRKRNK